METPAVSIIIPTYNRAHLIGETLQSVTSQTFADIEIIVIDDGSRDDTAQIMEVWCQRDSRIRYVQQNNGGVSSARNHGLRLIRGEFVAFIDSDDLWVPWKLELQVALMRALPQVGMMWSNMDAIDEGGHILKQRYLRTMYAAYRDRDDQYPFRESQPVPQLIKSAALPGEVPAATQVRTGRILRQMIIGNLVHTSTVLIRSHIARQVGFFKEAMRRGGEDYDFHLRTSAFTDVAYLDISTMKYRIGMEDQLTHTSNNLYFAQCYLSSIEPFLNEPGLLTVRERHAILATAHRWLAEQLFENGEHPASRSHLVKSLRHQPYSLASLKLIAKSVLPGRVLRQFRKWRGPKATVAAY